MIIKSGLDLDTPKDIRDLGSFSITELLRLCEDQFNLLKDDDRLIEQFTAQLSEYDQELYDEDVYIKELEDELRQTVNASMCKENLI